MKLTLRLTDLVLTADVEIDGPLLPTPPLPPPAPPVADPPGPAPEPPLALPTGYDSNPSVAWEMLRAAVRENSLNAIDVQRHGDRIVAALKRTYPTLDVYLSTSDAPVWPGFGSVDVTIDSGKGGWYFRPDGVTPWQPIGSR